ncbi:unnamed protein product [Zymoseptoria tritici ST99CH_1E4]|uniref:Gfo/Idh/MocA-like oxidoreductase N-terminal domain-containing protein n=1 Tax=Zymoseptoria tritici ST99CH_1E4 TaxID=1276532 RepID=A0A2H1FWS1_ZYMTR|nr:unnamed protein product [Zymoseptoria tritici ST99CH_1E4]
MEAENRVKIAIIGTGLIGPRHALSVQSCPDAVLLCIVDPRPEAQSVADEFNVPHFHSILRMLQGRCIPDAAIVCTPNSTHVALGAELLNNGIAALVEKPMSIDVASARELIDIARRVGKPLVIGHHRRFNPYVSAAKAALAAHSIGQPIAVSGLWVLKKPISYFGPPTDWRAKSGSGGPILINLIHEIDILHFLLGPIVRVHAEKTLSRRGHDVEEGVAMLFRFASGVVGTFILSDNIPSAHNFESGTGENPMIPKGGKDFYRIFGTEGTLSVGDMKLTRYGKGVEMRWENALQVEAVAVASDVPFDEQVKNFVEVVRGSEEPRCSGEDGLKAMIICDAVMRAMESGSPVDIDV